MKTVARRARRWIRAAMWAVAAGALGTLAIGAQGPEGTAAPAGCPGVQITIPLTGPGVDQYLAQHPPIQFPDTPGGPQQTPGQPPCFAELDLDGDGFLSYDEALAMPNMDELRFSDFDLNGDGYLSEDEMPPPGPPSGPGGPPQGGPQQEARPRRL